MGPRLPFWLAVVIERDEVAVVVPCVEPFGCNVISPALAKKFRDSPSGSEPAMDPGPLMARVLAGYMADPIE